MSYNMYDMYVGVMRAACCSMVLRPHLTGVCAVAAMLQLIGAEHALTRSSDCAMAKLIGFHGFDRPYRSLMIQMCGLFLFQILATDRTWRRASNVSHAET